MVVRDRIYETRITAVAPPARQKAPYAAEINASRPLIRDECLQPTRITPREKSHPRSMS